MKIFLTIKWALLKQKRIEYEGQVVERTVIRKRVLALGQAVSIYHVAKRIMYVFQSKIAYDQLQRLKVKYQMRLSRMYKNYLRKLIQSRILLLKIRSLSNTQHQKIQNTSFCRLVGWKKYSLNFMSQFLAETISDKASLKLFNFIQFRAMQQSMNKKCELFCLHIGKMQKQIRGHSTSK